MHGCMGVRRDATVVEVKLLFTVQFDINIIIDAVEKKLTLLDCKSSEFSSERDPHKPNTFLYFESSLSNTTCKQSQPHSSYNI